MASKSPRSRRTYHGAPQWVRALFSDSPAPPEIVKALVESNELGPLWDGLSDSQREYVDALPELVGFMVWGRSSVPSLPWSEKWTPNEQLMQAKRVAKLARELNKMLSTFAPLDPFGLHQLVPQKENAKHFFLVGLPPMATADRNGDSLLLRVATMAESFKPTKKRRVQRPLRPDAWETYFVRTFSPLYGDPQSHAFLAARVNAVSGGNWDSERVRKCLARSPETKMS